jgi:glycosyltransferase involved in cell wall biosynthesis
MGIVKNRLMIRLAEGLERICYRNARMVFTISHGIRQRLIERGLPSEKLKTFPIGVDLKDVDCIPKSTSFRLQNDLDGKFVAVYAGAFGPTNGLDLLMKASNYLKYQTEIVIVLIGEGKMKESLLAQKQQYELDNVLFLEAMPRTKLMSIMKDLDVGLMITKNLIPSMRQCLNLPRKFFDYLAAGLPVVVNVEGEMSKLVEENRIGLVSNEEDPTSLAHCILQLYSQSQLKEEMAMNAKQIIRKFDLNKIAEVFEKELLDSVSS